MKINPGIYEEYASDNIARFCLIFNSKKASKEILENALFEIYSTLQCALARGDGEWMPFIDKSLLHDEINYESRRYIFREKEVIDYLYKVNHLYWNLENDYDVHFYLDSENEIVWDLEDENIHIHLNTISF